MKKKNTTKEIGTITLGKEVYVTDPCYEVGTWCQFLVDNIKAGKYRCYIVSNEDDRVVELHAINEEYLTKMKENIKKVRYNADYSTCYIGVDSGQCGIFDAEYYSNHQSEEDKDLSDGWYATVCSITEPAGTIDGAGVASVSGYGDGMYEAYTATENGKIVALKMVFD